MHLSLHRFIAVWRKLPRATNHIVAFSGGLDSHVLLHLCAGLREHGLIAELAAVHVHHGLMANADVWSRHCETVARALAVEFHLRRVDAQARPGESPEEAARNARYGAFNQWVDSVSVCHVLTAQHQDDQAETVLLQLFRGCGLAGLSAMPKVIAFGKGRLVRPLLDFTRKDIHDYALANRLEWIDDPSNDDRAYHRNYLRHEIMPLLKARWPGVSQALKRTSQHCAESQGILAELSKRLLASARGSANNTLSIRFVSQLDSRRQRLVIRGWMTESGFRCPAARIIDQIILEVVSARSDRMPRVCWREGEVRRYRDDLFLLPVSGTFKSDIVLIWSEGAFLALPDHNGSLEAISKGEGGIPVEVWRKGRISVHYRQGGERCKLPGREGHHCLKKLFQEKGVPPWVRQRTPLIYVDEKLAAIADIWVCEPFFSKDTGESIQIAWRR